MHTKMAFQVKYLPNKESVEHSFWKLYSFFIQRDSNTVYTQPYFSKKKN